MATTSHRTPARRPLSPLRAVLIAVAVAAGVTVLVPLAIAAYVCVLIFSGGAQIG